MNYYSMVVYLSDKFPKFEDKIINIVKNNLPIKDLNYEFLAVDGEDIGISFEQRIRVDYEVYSNEIFRGTYSSTFVIEKNNDLYIIIDSRWTKKLF
jgi:hypothetical protein